MRSHSKIALTIAGSDPSGGAGLQADLKTFHQHGVYGSSVVTLVTVQNTLNVSEVSVLSSNLVASQLTAVLEDLPVAAIKTGALGSVENILEISKVLALTQLPLVIDPVLVSKHGARLASDDAVGCYKEMLFPLARLLTPNAAEAEVLTGISVIDTRSAKLAAEKLLELGLKNVLIKGGHVAGPDVIDVLFTNNEVYELEQKRINTKNTHGTGCVYSAAITANLALGDSIVTAVSKANDFVHRAIETNPNLGHGFGPINMFASPKMTNS